MITFGYLLLIIVYILAVLLRRRKGQAGLAVEAVLAVMMVGVLVVFFVPKYGW